MNRRWPNSRTAFWNPDLKNGIRRRPLYEDPNARISILACGMAARPDTLKQTDDLALSIKPLADGAGHTFLMSSIRTASIRLGHCLTSSRLRPTASELPYQRARVA